MLFNIKETSMRTFFMLFLFIFTSMQVACTDKDDLNEVSLFEATKNGNFLEVQRLLEQGVNINIKEPDSSLTPLLIAVATQQNEIIKLFVTYNVNLEMKHIDFTPLMFASSNGYTRTAEILLNAGADIEAKDMYGFTALGLASEGGAVETVKLLLNNEANTETRDEMVGFTPLMIASCRGYSTIVEILLHHGANIDVTDNEGKTPLISASGACEIDILEILTNHELKGIQLANSIIKANENYVATVQTLINAGAYIEARDSNSKTALLLASIEGNTEVVQILLQNKANIEVVTHEGSTPLLYASVFGHMRTVEVLLDNGADINIQDKYGSTAFTLAKGAGKIQIVELLKQYGAE